MTKRPGANPTPATAVWRSPGRGVLVRVSLAVLLALAGGLVFTWPRVQTFKSGYLISQLETRRATLIDEQGALLIEVESLRALRRIAKLAQDQLSMHQPKPEQVVVVDFSKPRKKARTSRR